MKTRDQLITDAFRKIGGLSDYEVLTAQQITAGTNALQSALLHLQTMGMPLWKLAQWQLPLSSFANGNITISTVGGPGVVASPTIPLKVVSVQRYDALTGIAIPIDVMERTRWYESPRPPASVGAPIECYAWPQKDRMVITVWPMPSSYWLTNGTIRADMQFSWTAGTTLGTTQPDFPDYWEQALIYELATKLAPEYSLPLSDRKMLLEERTMYVEEAKSFGNEEGSVYLQPTRSWDHR